MTRTASTTALAALALPLWVAPALAAGSFQLVDSQALLGVRAYAGIAIADANLPCVDLPDPDTVEQCSYSGSLGSFTAALTNLPQGPVGIAGAGTAFAAESQWQASMTLEWQTRQGYTLTPAGTDLVLQSQGLHVSALTSVVGGPGAVQPGIREVAVMNLQTLVFTLDQTTSFSFSSSSVGGYMPIQISTLDSSGQFVGEGNIPESFTGQLQAGTYRLRNFHLLQTSSADDYRLGWNYTLTLHDTVAAVPEPGSMVLLALGLGLVSAWRRGRAPAA